MIDFDKCGDTMLKEFINNQIIDCKEETRETLHKWNHLLIRNPELHEEFQDVADEVWNRVVNYLYIHPEGDMK